MYILIFGKNTMIWGIFQIFLFIKEWKIPPNHSPFEKVRKKLFQKSECTHVSTINVKGKESD